MPRRSISAEEDKRIIQFLFDKDDKGQFLYSQRDVETLTGVSRIYIRKLAKSTGRSFTKTIDIAKPSYTCANCGKVGERSPSRISIVKNTFCSKDCKKQYQQDREEATKE